MKRLTASRLAGVLLSALVFLCVCLAIGLAVGPSGAPLGSILEVLARPSESGPLADIVWRVRLPRLVLAMGVGASLSLAGLIFQALLRNPLADPFVLGVSGGAALGGIAVLALGATVGLGSDAVPLAGFGPPII